MLLDAAPEALLDLLCGAEPPDPAAYRAHVEALDVDTVSAALREATDVALWALPADVDTLLPLRPVRPVDRRAVTGRAFRPRALPRSAGRLVVGDGGVTAEDASGPATVPWDACAGVLAWRTAHGWSSARTACRSRSGPRSGTTVQR